MKAYSVPKQTRMQNKSNIIHSRLSEDGSESRIHL
jgi:hypothetical protein